MFNLGATTKRSDLPIIALVAGLVVVACAQNGLAQSPKRDVSLRLDWLFQGPNSGFMVAKDKGYYDAAGLNVDIGPGRGSEAPLSSSPARPPCLAFRTDMWLATASLGT